MLSARVASATATNLDSQYKKAPQKRGLFHYNASIYEGCGSRPPGFGRGEPVCGTGEGRGGAGG